MPTIARTESIKRTKCRLCFNHTFKSPPNIQCAHPNSWRHTFTACATIEPFTPHSKHKPGTKPLSTTASNSSKRNKRPTSSKPNQGSPNQNKLNTKRPRSSQGSQDPRTLYSWKHSTSTFCLASQTPRFQPLRSQKESTGTWRQCACNYLPP